MTTQHVWKRKPTSFANNNEYIPDQRKEKSVPYCHMSICEAIKLTKGDVIDHRGHYQKFKQAIIKAKNGSCLLIHYFGSIQNKYDVWSDYTKELDRFAVTRSISQRKAHRLKHLKMGDFVNINPLKVDPGWKCGKIIKMDLNSAQVCVEYLHGNIPSLYWTHLDNLQEIDKQTTRNKQLQPKNIQNKILTLSENKLYKKKQAQSKLLAMGYNMYYVQKAMEQYLQIYKDSNYTKTKKIVAMIQKIQKEQHQKTLNKNQKFFQQQKQFRQKTDSNVNNSMATLDNYKEELYEMIEKIEPKYAGKITGMLLELDPNYVMTLLSDVAALKIQMKRAMDFILLVPQLSAMGFATDLIESAIYHYQNLNPHHKFNEINEIIKIIGDLQGKNNQAVEVMEQRKLKQRLWCMGYEYDPFNIQIAIKQYHDQYGAHRQMDINEIIRIIQNLRYKQQQQALLCKLDEENKRLHAYWMSKNKKVIGDQLFAKIAAIGPTFISKITGMIMEFDVHKLMLLNNNPNYLLKTVNEAVAFLKASNYTESEQLQKVEAGDKCQDIDYEDENENDNNTYDQKKEGEDDDEYGDNELKQLTEQMIGVFGVDAKQKKQWIREKLFHKIEALEIEAVEIDAKRKCVINLPRFRRSAAARRITGILLTTMNNNDLLKLLVDEKALIRRINEIKPEGRMLNEVEEEKQFNLINNIKSNQQKKYRKKSKTDIIYILQRKKIAQKWIEKAMPIYESMYGDRYNLKVICEIVERLQNKEMIQNDLNNKVENRIRYDLWQWSDVLKWIINIDNGRFRKYKNVLSVKLKDERMNGLCLFEMDKNDIYRIGIANDGDREILLEKIAEMLKQNGNCHGSELQIEGY